MSTTSSSVAVQAICLPVSCASINFATKKNTARGGTDRWMRNSRGKKYWKEAKQEIFKTKKDIKGRRKKGSAGVMRIFAEATKNIFRRHGLLCGLA